MKKYPKIIVVTLVLVLALSMSACGGGESINATFGISAMAEGDQEYGEDMLGIALGENYADENFIKFDSDNSFTMTLMGSTIDGTYKKKGDDITLTSKEETFGDSVKGTMDGNTFFIEVEGMKITFTKK